MLVAGMDRRGTWYRPGLKSMAEHGRVVATASPGLADHLRLEILQVVVLGAELAGKERPGDHDRLVDCAIG